MLHMIAGRVTDVTERQYVTRDGEDRVSIEVTVAAGKEACVTTGNDDQYIFDEKVCLKVSARMIGSSMLRYERIQKLDPLQVASDLAVYAEGS